MHEAYHAKTTESTQNRQEYIHGIQ